MEFLEEDAGPRFLFHSKVSQQPTRPDPETLHLHKPTLLLSLFLSALLLILSFTYFNSDPLKSILIWISLSFLLGPFAPPSLTAGDIRVGIGPPIEEPATPIEQPDDNTNTNTKRINKRASKFSRKTDDPIVESDLNGSIHVGPAVGSTNGTGHKPSVKLAKTEENDVNLDMKWTDEDDELLKKSMARHPVGKPGRWEAIAGGFKGRHTVESVIKRAKESGEKKLSDDDSYKRFLKDRKPMDTQIEAGNESTIDNNEGKAETVGWTSGEDLALLNALKVFPKDVAMRWEKIAAAVPGKSKAACMRRVTHLKKDFRSSKASGSVA